MKRLVVLVLFFLANTLVSQQTVSGTFSPAEEFTYLLVYQLTPLGENYVADTAIDQGEFSFSLPKGSEAGMYRMVYAIPQNEFYIDLLYDGKEDIELHFDLTEGVTFSKSEENKIFRFYFTTINTLEQEIIDSYNTETIDSTEVMALFKTLKETQEAYEKQSAGLLVHTFIVANRGYHPQQFETKEAYIQNRKKKYFDHLDFENKLLQASGFFTDKISNYVFTALPTEPTASTDVSTAIRENIDTVADRLKALPNDYQFFLLHKIWEQTAANELDSVSDHIYNNYLKSKAHSSGNLQKLAEIENKNRLRLGAKAPEIEWVNDTEAHKLSTISGGERYVLVFWSSTCSHCLNELPALHETLNGRKEIKVIAVGLEDGEDNWKKEAAKLERFEHVISLGKWESAYAKLYNIQKTPTYFVLDSEKRIIDKPEDLKGLLAFLKR